MGASDEDEISAERTVSGFYLDRFEVTVGRFRAFQSNYVIPEDGEGVHPRIPGTGWRAEWNEVPNFAGDGTAVPPDKDKLLAQLTDECETSTWAAGDPELPISCVNWYVAFAFCAWDGGRLPTEAEWNYAAAFGDAKRPYPWSESATDVAIDIDHAVFFDYPTLPQDLPSTVGSRSPGRGGFVRRSGKGHDDLAGNLYEWTLDQWVESPPQSCSVDCLASWEDGIEDRVIRGGAYISPYGEVYTGWRTSAPASNVDYFIGFRCARDVQRSLAE